MSTTTFKNNYEILAYIGMRLSFDRAEITLRSADLNLLESDMTIAQQIQQELLGDGHMTVELISGDSIRLRIGDWAVTLNPQTEAAVFDPDETPRSNLVSFKFEIPNARLEIWGEKEFTLGELQEIWGRLGEEYHTIGRLRTFRRLRTFGEY